MVHNSPKHLVYGEFCERNNWLTVNLGVCGNVREIIKTTIHEYTHHIQKGLKQNYNSSVEKNGYYDSPFEVEARENEKIYKSVIWKEFKQSES